MRSSDLTENLTSPINKVVQSLVTRVGSGFGDILVPEKGSLLFIYAAYILLITTEDSISHGSSRFSDFWRGKGIHSGGDV